jgi:putative transposase
VDLFSPEVLEQKLNYIHLNPLQEKWNLVRRPEDYLYSSASFYELGKDNFNILTHYKDVY